MKQSVHKSLAVKTSGSSTYNLSDEETDQVTDTLFDTIREKGPKQRSCSKVSRSKLLFKL